MRHLRHRPADRPALQASGQWILLGPACSREEWRGVQRPITGTVRSEVLTPGHVLVDLATGEDAGTIDFLRSFAISLDGHSGVSLLARASEEAQARGRRDRSPSEPGSNGGHPR
jgi:hypothetical protein